MASRTRKTSAGAIFYHEDHDGRFFFRCLELSVGTGSLALRSSFHHRSKNMPPQREFRPVDSNPRRNAAQAMAAGDLTHIEFAPVSMQQQRAIERGTNGHQLVRIDRGGTGCGAIALVAKLG